MLKTASIMFYIGCLFPNKEMLSLYNVNMKPNFDVELLPEAVEFLENLDEKTREKIYYNIKKSQFLNDKELFKKLNEFI